MSIQKKDLKLSNDIQFGIHRQLCDHAAGRANAEDVRQGQGAVSLEELLLGNEDYESN